MYFKAGNSSETPSEPAGTDATRSLDAADAAEPSALPEGALAEDELPEDDGSAETEEAEAAAEEQAVESAFEGVSPVLTKALERRGFTALTAVQRAVVAADDGKRDLRISSQTGSGKTVALGMALLDGIVAGLADPDRKGPTTLVIAPTRELAMQVKEELSWLFADVRGATCEVVTGGTNLDRELVRLRRRPAVVVGTPGRLCDHVRRGGLDLSQVRQLVLDEADQMLDLGFKDELDALVAELPPERRTHLVSATFPAAVKELADRCQKKALEVQGTARGEAHADIEHIACRIQSREHYQALVNLLLMAGDDRALVFVRTREETTSLADKLAADGFAALPLNGDIAQAQRTRTLKAFKNGSVKALIATDVAARGIDVPAVTLVVHMELPIDPETYVHRSGRTGRAGQKGRSVMLVPKSRAARTERLYRLARIAARWASPPTAAAVAARQLERAEAAALAKIDSGFVATPALRASAANLLRERDPIEVVATLLAMTTRTTRAPFDVGVPAEPEPMQDVRSAPAPRESSLGARRGKPGAAPSWRGGGAETAPERPAAPGFTRFRINWGTRDGADPRRVLAHVCRRGEIDSRMVGAIALGPAATTFDVADTVAEEFATRAQRRDRREPHLIIGREGFGPKAKPMAKGKSKTQRSAIRTRQSR